MKNPIILLFILISLTQLVNSMSLDDFLLKVKNQNLEVKEQSYKTNEKYFKKYSIGLNGPMAMWTKTQSQSWGNGNMFEVTQTLPFPTKLYFKYKMNSEEYESQIFIEKQSEAIILAKARFEYFQLWALEEKLNHFNEIKKILADHINLARSRVRSDNELKIHLLNSETDMDMVIAEILELEQLKLEQTQKLAIMINEDPLNFHIKTEKMQKTKIPSVLEDDSFFLRGLKSQLSSIEYKSIYAHHEWLPDFTFKYIDNPTNSPAMQYQTSIGVSFPFLFFWEPLSTSKMAKYEKLQNQVRYENGLLKQKSEVVFLKSKIKKINEILELFESSILPRAEKRKALVMNLAPREMNSLREQRETLENLPQLQIKYVNYRIEYEKLVSELNSYTLSSEKE